MNCCLTFLFFNCVAGIFVFVILGVFTVTDNRFLVLMNFKEIDGKKEYKDEDKKNAYLQYFLAAIFNVLFAFTIWYIPKIKELVCKKKGQSPQIRKEMQIINEPTENINNKINDTNRSNLIDESEISNNDINTTNTIEKFSINKTGTENDLGMTEKVEY